MDGNDARGPDDASRTGEAPGADTNTTGEAPPGRPVRRRSRPLVMTVALHCVLVYAGLLALILLFQNSLIYFPTRGLTTDPFLAGVKGEDVFLVTADGVKIHGWYLSAERPVATVLFLHGNAGNIDGRLDNGIELTKLGLDVLLIDYRGFGKSDGSPDEHGTYRDADAAYDYLMTRPGMSAAKLIVFGRSLGAAVAIDLAVRKPCGALVIESAFASIRRLARTLFPYSLFSPFLPNRYDSISKIGKIRCPLMVVHGPPDELIPYSHGRALFDAAPQPKRFFDLNGAGHNDWYRLDPKGYFDAWRRFIADSVDRRGT